MYTLILCVFFLCVIPYIIPLLALCGAFTLGVLCAVAWMVRLLFVQSYHAYTTISRWVKNAH